MASPHPLRLAVIALALDEAPHTRGDEHQLALSPAREAAARAAILAAREASARVVLFSGWTGAGALSDPLSVPLVQAMIDAGMFGVLELVEDPAARAKTPGKVVHSGLPVEERERSPHRAYVVIDGQNGRVARLSEQVVWTNYMADRTEGRLRLERLAGELVRGGARRHMVDGYDLAVLVCGENNYFFQNRRGAPRPRWPSFPQWEDHDLCFNPKHTMVTRPEVTRRLESLSTGGRLALSCANFTPSQRYDSRVLHVARDGRVDRSAQAVDGGGYRMVVVEAGVRFSDRDV